MLNGYFRPNSALSLNLPAVINKQNRRLNGHQVEDRLCKGHMNYEYLGDSIHTGIFAACSSKVTTKLL